MSSTSPTARPGGRRRAEKPKSKVGIRGAGALAVAAVAVTGIAVGGGVLGGLNGDTPAVSNVADAVDLSTTADVGKPADREAPISRNDRRAPVDPAKRAGLNPGKPAAVSQAERLSQSDPKDIAKALFPEYGFSASEFGCLESLWERESGWDPLAHNPSSGAHGIPQSLPGSKMASEGADWYDNPVTQIKWGLGYIQDRYGTPCAAWGHSESHNWY